MLNPNNKVNIEVKNTIRDLNLVLIDNTIRAKGSLEHAELPLYAKTPFFLPNRSRLADLIITHILIFENFFSTFFLPRIKTH